MRWAPIAGQAQKEMGRQSVKIMKRFGTVKVKIQNLKNATLAKLILFKLNKSLKRLNRL